MPFERILLLEHHVALVQEREEFGRRAQQLEGMESGQAVRDGASVIFVAVDDEHGRLPIGEEIWSGWVVAFQTLDVLPKHRGAAEISRVAEVIGLQHEGGHVEDAVVADQGFELTSNEGV